MTETSVTHTKLTGRDLTTGDGLQIKIQASGIHSMTPAKQSSDLWISSGLVDLQVNGYAGLDLNGDDLSADGVSALVRKLIQTGVTLFAPDTDYCSGKDLLQRLRCIDEACRADPLSDACIAFIHMEGPHISAEEGFCGAHPPEHVRPPSLEEFDRWQAACNGRIGMVTLSPHYAGSEKYIAALAERGVLVSLGHTHATPRQIESAVQAGARLSTHLGNGIATRIDRHQNPIWSQLANQLLTASFIADGHHLPAEMLQAMIRAKGIERSILVSDTVALAGMPPGEYSAKIGGRVSLSKEGRLSIAGTSLLAGSAVPLLGCVERAVRMTGLPLADVLRMATEGPGRFAGGGVLRAGARADILRFRWDDEAKTVEVYDVWVAGKPQYSMD